MKIESRKYINISKIVEYLLELTLQQSFLKFMELQGVTQLLFYMVLGKLKFLKMSKWKRKTQASKGNWCFMLKSLFIQTVCYSRKEEDSLTETRVRLYRQMNIKTSQSLPPDEKSMLQAIKSIHHYEIYYCLTVDEAIVRDISLQDNVWIVDKKNEEFRPLWFTCMFFLISCFHFYSNQQI